MSVAASLACPADTAFQCEDDAACGAGGQCELNGYCSFPDGTCASGRRFGSFAVAGIADLCVPTEASMSTGAESSTSASPDAGSTTTGASPDMPWPHDGDSTSSTTDPVDPVDPAGDESGTTGDPGTTGTSVRRVEDGLTVLYQLYAGTTGVVSDTSGTLPAIDLELVGTGYAFTATGLAFSGESSTIAQSTGSLSKLNFECSSSNAITLESWVTPGDTAVPGPARILTYSQNSGARNFSLLLGQDISGDSQGWKARLRTSSTGVNGTPNLEFLEAPRPGIARHFVFVHESDGDERLYLDGAEVASGVRTSSFSSWTTDGTMSLALGNELSLDRAIDAEIHLVAIYCRALSDAEVQQNADAGF